MRIRKESLHTSQGVPDMDKMHTVLEVTEAIKQLLERTEGQKCFQSLRY